MYGQDRQEWTLEPGVDLACGFYGKNRLLGHFRAGLCLHLCAYHS